jgi:agmatinase
MKHNYLKLPESFSSYQNAKVVIVPVSYDRTSSWMRGSRKGPGAIIKASRYLELYDIETDFEVYRQGICTGRSIRAFSSVSMIAKVRSVVNRLLEDGKFVVVLGGEHSVSIGTVGAHSERYNGMSVLHLDAHADTRDFYQGNRYSHACTIARVRELADTVVSVGIRSMDSGEIVNIQKDRIFFARKIKNSHDWIEKVVSGLSENVYVTVDLDVFDPAFIPSTGTPEPGGLDWYEVTEVLKAVAEERVIVGFDVVELCPSGAKSSDFLAAKLVYKMLSYRFCKGG